MPGPPTQKRTPELTQPSPSLETTAIYILGNIAQDDRYKAKKDRQGRIDQSVMRFNELEKLREKGKDVNLMGMEHVKKAIVEQRGEQMQEEEECTEYKRKLGKLMGCDFLVIGTGQMRPSDLMRINDFGRVN